MPGFLSVRTFAWSYWRSHGRGVYHGEAVICLRQDRKR
jgi:hypothetical protein